jgi:probable HAF family extracellular repeat protein
MKNRGSLLFCLLGLTLSVSSVSAAGLKELKVTYAVEQVPDTQVTKLYGINNAGVVLGQYQNFDFSIHGFIKYPKKKLVNIVVPNALPGKTVPNGLNLNGPVSVVGWYEPSSGDHYIEGFLYKNGEYTDIPGPSGSTASFGFGINDLGTIVGAYADASGTVHGFLLENGTYTTLDMPGAAVLQTFATGINDSGDIVVWWIDSFGVGNSALYHKEADREVYTPINVPNAAQSNYPSINSHGDICFQWWDAIGVSHGALLHAGKHYEFDFPTHTGTYAGGINDVGNIVGYTSNLDIQFGFKATYQLPF